MGSATVAFGLPVPLSQHVFHYFYGIFFPTLQVAATSDGLVRYVQEGRWHQLSPSSFGDQRGIQRSARRKSVRGPGRSAVRTHVFPPLICQSNE